MTNKTNPVVATGGMVKTPIGRCSFPCLTTPKMQQDGSTLKYELEVIFNKDSDFSELQEAIVEIAKEAWGDEIEYGDLAVKPFKNGDEKVNKKTGQLWEGYEGGLYINPRSKSAVQYFGRDTNAVEAEAFYPGCRVVAVVAPCAYNGTSGKSVTFLLKSVQFVGDEDRFGGQTKVDPSILTNYETVKKNPVLKKKKAVIPKEEESGVAASVIAATKAVKKKKGGLVDLI